MGQEVEEILAKNCAFNRLAIFGERSPNITAANGRDRMYLRNKTAGILAIHGILTTSRLASGWSFQNPSINTYSYTITKSNGNPIQSDNVYGFASLSNAAAYYEGDYLLPNEFLIIDFKNLQASLRVFSFVCWGVNYFMKIPENG